MKLPQGAQYSDIQILAPRWKDKTVLIADWKIGKHNIVTINARRKDGTPYYPKPLYISGDKVRTYPKQAHSSRFVHIVPLADLETLDP